MSRIDDVIKKLNIKDITKCEERLLKEGKSKDYIKNIFADVIYGVIKDDDIGIKVYVLNILSPFYVNELLAKNDESLYIAALILDHINGKTVSDIINKDEFDLAKASNLADSILYGSDREKIYHKLKDYLKSKNMDSDTLSKMINQHVFDFAKELPSIQKAFFNIYTGKNSLDKSLIINSLFNTPGIDIETLQKIYDNILTKNSTFISFDYNEIFFNKINVDYMTKIKGLYKKIPRDMLVTMTSINVKDIEKLNNYINQIINLNKDDETCLRIFIDNLYNYALTHNKKLGNCIKNQDYYLKYGNKIDYNSLVEKILNGECNLDDELLIKLGESSDFLKKYDEILDLFMNSQDTDLRRKITIPLTVGLLHKLKKQHKLDFDIVFTSKNLDKNLGGFYDDKTNVIYVNPLTMKLYKDVELGLILSINTIFHEVRHAMQINKDLKSNDFSFDNLIIFIDYYLKDHLTYYSDNYQNISLERDARYNSYIETSVFLKKYPNVLDKFQKKEKEEFNKFYDYIRKDGIDGTYYGTINYFVKSINDLLNSKTMNNRNQKFIMNNLKSYPIFNKFFDIDYGKKQIKVKSEKYFDNMQKLFNLLPDNERKKEGLYSINAFKYALKVGKYLNQKKNDIESFEEVVNDVGKTPTR